MSHLEETFAAGVLTLTMNRPEARNAMSGEMMTALREAVPRAAANPQVRCLVLTGAGNAFCAGGDVKGFATPDDGADTRDTKRANNRNNNRDNNREAEDKSLEGQVHSLRQQMEVSRLLHEMPKPTLAIIPGAAAGAGLSLALACDLRFALDTAKLTTAFAKIGASGDYGGSYFLTYLVGTAKARELYFTADVITGEEALAIGLVNRIATVATFEHEAEAYARHLASLPTVALGYMKKNLNAAQHAGLGQVLDLEAAHMMRTFMTEDHKQAVTAFINKQPPEFKGY